MEHNWNQIRFPRPKNKRLHGYRFRQSPSTEEEVPMDCGNAAQDPVRGTCTGTSRQFCQSSASPKFSTLNPDQPGVSAAKCPRLDPTIECTGNQEPVSKPVKLSVSHGETPIRSRPEQYQLQKTNEIKAIKILFRESGLFPVPNSDDMVYLTMELKRRQYCQKHGILYASCPEISSPTGQSSVHKELTNPETVPSMSGNVLPTKRHSEQSTEEEGIPRKLRVLQSGI